MSRKLTCKHCGREIVECDEYAKKGYCAVARNHNHTDVGYRHHEDSGSPSHWCSSERTQLAWPKREPIKSVSYLVQRVTRLTMTCDSCDLRISVSDDTVLPLDQYSFERAASGHAMEHDRHQVSISMITTVEKMTLQGTERTP